MCVCVLACLCVRARVCVCVCFSLSLSRAYFAFSTSVSTRRTPKNKQLIVYLKVDSYIENILDILNDHLSNFTYNMLMTRMLLY